METIKMIIAIFFLVFVIIGALTIIIGIPLLIFTIIRFIVIAIRCKIDPNFKREYENKLWHKHIKNNLEYYYGNKKVSSFKKRKYKQREYYQSVYDSYESWRNPKS